VSGDLDEFVREVAKRYGCRRVLKLFAEAIRQAGRIQIGQGLFDALAVGDIDGLALESMYRKSARAQFANQLHPELAGAAKNYRPFGHRNRKDTAAGAIGACWR
jgi:hypothetical protein